MAGRKQLAKGLQLSAAIYYLLPFTFCLLPFTYSSAPPLTCQITEISPRNRTLKVSCTLSNLPPGKLQLRFMDQFAGLTRLSERIFGLKVKDVGGASWPLEIRGDGIYALNLKERASELTLNYDLRLARALDPSQYAFTSSLGPDAGFLMLADVLPQIFTGAESESEAVNAVRLQINAPDGWHIATTEEQRGDFFEVTAPPRAVFFLGHYRERELRVSKMKLRVAIVGDWSFTDDRLAQLMETMIRAQADFIGGQEQGNCLVTLAPFPLPLTGLRSSGLTRGRTVVLMLNAADDPAVTFAHYERHLAHELFHFYLPNAFRVRENFDWFWEGFTRYVALTTLQRQHLITTRDYLDAISQEYEAYAANPARTRLSLIAASPDKFANLVNYDLVYRKGMLVAALYDLERRWQSRGTSSLKDVMRVLYRNYATTSREIGNREVLAELEKGGDFARFIRDYIEGTREIDLAVAVKPYGLVIGHEPNGGSRPRLMPAPKLSARQRDLLSGLEK